MSEHYQFKLDVGRALGIPDGIAEHMGPEHLVEEITKLRRALQGRPRPVGKPRRGALVGDPFADVAAMCQAGIAVADAWCVEARAWLHALPPELVKALDALESVTRTSTLRKVQR